jgi:dihydrodipicolinate synthase/N-acetylneuraminate lyase
VKRFEGLFAATVTPLDAAGEIDGTAIDTLVPWLADRGVEGLFVLGTTGEGLMLSGEERVVMTERFVAASAGGLPVIAHCGAMTTAEARELARRSAAAGADAVAAIAPPFYPLGEGALVEYLTAVAAAAPDLPFFAYQLPSRTGHDLTPEILRKVAARAANLVGVKDTTKSAERLAAYLRDDSLAVMVGSEEMTLEALRGGAAGSTSAVAGVYPEVVAAVFEAHRNGDGAGAERAQRRLSRLRGLLRRGPYLAAYKWALGRRGVPVGPTMRRPLVELSGEESRQLRAQLDDFEADGE